MNVLLVAHHVPPRHVGGTEVYTARLARALAPRHRVTVLATDDDPRSEPRSVRRRRWGDVEVVEVAEPRAVREPSDTWSSAWAEAAFCRVIAEARPQVCHFQHLRFLSMALPSIARREGVATVMTLHDYWLLCARDGQLVDHDGARCDGPAPTKCATCLAGFRFGLSPAELRVARIVDLVRSRTGLDWSGGARRAGLALRALARNLRRGKGLPHAGTAGMLAVIEARRAAAGAVEAGIDVFIAPSAFLKAVFDGAGFGGGRMRVVRHGTDGSPRGPVHEGSASGPLKIGFAGTVAPPKGLHILIRAVRKLPEGSYVVDVHGRDDLRPEYARALAREARGLPVRFHGAFDPDQGAGLRDGWDVAVVPSRWVENQPLAILEAHAAGVPVVASDLGGMRELVRDGVDGRLFEPDSPDSLAEVLGELVRDRGGLARLRAGVRPPPTMAEHAAEIESAYADAVAGAGAPR